MQSVRMVAPHLDGNEPENLNLQYRTILLIRLNFDPHFPGFPGALTKGTTKMPSTAKRYRPTKKEIAAANEQLLLIQGQVNDVINQNHKLREEIESLKGFIRSAAEVANGDSSRELALAQDLSSARGMLLEAAWLTAGQLRARIASFLRAPAFRTSDTRNAAQRKLEDFLSYSVPAEMFRQGLGRVGQANKTPGPDTDVIG